MLQQRKLFRLSVRFGAVDSTSCFLRRWGLFYVHSHCSAQVCGSPLLFTRPIPASRNSTVDWFCALPGVDCNGDGCTGTFLALLLWVFMYTNSLCSLVVLLCHAALPHSLLPQSESPSSLRVLRLHHIQSWPAALQRIDYHAGNPRAHAPRHGLVRVARGQARKCAGTEPPDKTGGPVPPPNGLFGGARGATVQPQKRGQEEGMLAGAGFESVVVG